MDLQFSELMFKIFPFYLIILLGFIAGKFLKVDRQSIANVLFYIIVPAVFFDFGLRLSIPLNYFLLPVVIYMLSVVLNMSYMFICNRIWPNDSRANVVAFAAGTANTGYFGLPVALMLFDIQTVGIFMLMNIGMSFYDYTLGAFTMARGKFSRKQAFMSVLKLPILYAFFLGMLFHYFEVPISLQVEALGSYFTGTYAILGMMVIGLGLSTIQKLQMDWKFVLMMLSSRFVAAPLLTFALIMLDGHFIHAFPREVHLAAMLTSIVPPAANTVIFASIHHAHPENAAMGVVTGTLLALIYLPFMAALLF